MTLYWNLKIRKVKMTVGTLMVVLMVTITAESTEKCQKLDPVLWNYTSCPYPESNEWIRLKNKTNCDKDRDYHCASNSQGCDVQLCVKRTYCEAGHGPLLDPVKDTAICAPCPQNRYQTTGFWSNQRSCCEHEKTKCDGIIKIECQPGSTITDRSCRCNILQNLTLQNYTLHNETCCTKNDRWCECIQFKSPCPNGTVRHFNYKCLKECPPNSFRPWDSDTCYPNSQTVTVEMTTADQTPASGSTVLPDTVNVGLIVGFILGGLVLAVLLIGICEYCRRKRRQTGERIGNESGQPLVRPLGNEMTGGQGERIGNESGQPLVRPLGNEMTGGQGRPGERTSNGHIDGQEPVDIANSHIDGQEPVDMGEGEGHESSAACVQPLVKKMTGGKVIVGNLNQNSVIYKGPKAINIHGGGGNTFNVGNNNKTKTTIISNPVTGNE